MSSTFEDIFREWARAEIQKIDVANYNGALLSYTDKAKMANVLGLDERQKLGVTPFPGNVTNNTLVTQPAQPEKSETVPANKKSSWLPLIGATLAGAALTAGGIGAATYISGKPVVQTQTDNHGKVGVDVIGWPKQNNQ